VTQPRTGGSLAHRTTFTPPELIRNFCIIAHIDHGKSTLADRILELTETVTGREMRAQVLDSMELERERGITIKAQAVRVEYRAADGQAYHLHLIDTPGHVDFSYEVSRSLAACEGALLVVDAAQGVEAQTLANVYQSIEHDHEIVPVINKIDLPDSNPDRVLSELATEGLQPEEWGGDTMFVDVSAKTKDGLDDLLEAILLLAEVEETCSRLLILNRGRVAAQGTVSEIARQAAAPPSGRVRVPGEHARAALGVLGGVEGVEAAAADGQTGLLTVTYADADGRLNEGLRAILDAGIPLLSFELEGARLSDAFLAMTEVQ